MANPTPGDLKLAYNRTYIVINPIPSLGPPTYRISDPDDISNGKGIEYNFEDEAPIVVSTTQAAINKPIVVTTEMDITLLNKRKA